MTVRSGAIENFERLVRESASPVDDHEVPVRIEPIPLVY